MLQRKRRNDYFESKEDADAIVDSCNDDTSGTEETRVVRDIKNLSEIPRSDRDRQLSNNRKIILETSPSMCYKSCSYEILSSGIRAAPGSEWSHASLKESFL